MHISILPACFNHYCPACIPFEITDFVELHAGNWQWKLDSIDSETQTMHFAFGGFQDAHGGPVASNYFFAENVPTPSTINENHGEERTAALARQS
jgi:hypothetical protein